MRPLHDLLREFRSPLPSSLIANLQITGIAEDSRLVQPGNLFIARGGTQTDGSKYIEEAQRRGAVAVVTTPLTNCPLPQIPYYDPSAAASLLANAFYDHPSESFKVLGVTGTNGKTTTTYLIRHVLNKLKQRCGMIGTVEIDDGRACHESTMTTPGAIELAQLLAAMRDKQCKAAALEISSHSLHQGRVAGVHFAGAAFTNLTGDHLDYHQTMDHYAAAKAMLFEKLPSHGIAAVNADDPWTPRIIRDCPARITRFGFNESADYRARDIAATADGTHFILHTPDGNAEVSLQLIGKHNIENALAASALLGEVFGLSVHQLAAALKDATGAPGRLQTVRANQPFAVLVDYAHTDDALENVLTALRPLTRNRLIVLFGCGGDRDRTKRPRMAATAQKLADVLYVTSDNPRTENPQRILDEITAGLDGGQPKQVYVQIDRRLAIEQALAQAVPGDVVLIAGKGHENYQIIGTTKHHFDDAEECQRVLAGRSVAA
jgi:UDP-N-acetylmuramoyl-L-alanyl-D-glutamate--2,6-diaminopimelate ligase